MTPPDTREVIARALASMVIDRAPNEAERIQADAILSALAANHLGVVPEEPTKEMLFAGTDQLLAGTRHVWKAMFNAAVRK